MAYSIDKQHPSSTLKTLLISLLLTLLLLGNPCFALELYSGEAPISDESDNGRKMAIRNAFRQMITKVTGSQQFAYRPEMASVIADAENYMLSYGYRDLQQGDIELRRIQVQFSQARVEQILEEKNIPVWRAGRPNLMIWVAIENNGERHLLQPGIDQAYLDTLEDAAKARGLPYLFPLMDLQDRARVKISDLWNGILDDVQAASRRYAADVVLVGRIQANPDGIWNAQWSMLGEDMRVNWSNAASGFNASATEALDTAADKLAERYAPKNSLAENNAVLLSVENIRNQRDYARVNKFLSRLGSVGQAMIYLATPDSLTYKLTVRGPVRTLEQEISLGGIMKRQPGGGLPNRNGEIELFYRMIL